MPTKLQAAPEKPRNGNVTVLVCGSRNWTDGEAIYQKLKQINPSLIIHGAARGADLLAEDAAKRLEIDYHGYPAKWRVQGRSAGPIRNRHQFRLITPDLVLAFHSNLDESKGTADMVCYAISQGCPVFHFDGSCWREL